MKKIVALTGPSGAGKSTLIRLNLKNSPDPIGRRVSLSYTTRKPRKSEDSMDYHFVSEKEFRKMIKAGDFLEWAEVHESLYGTSKRKTEEMLEEGITVFFDIDLQGAQKLRSLWGDSVHLVFVVTPSWLTLQRRLLGRGSETSETFRIRLREAQRSIATVLDEINQGYEWSILVNGDITHAAEALEIMMGDVPMYSTNDMAMLSGMLIDAQDEWHEVK